MDVVVKSPAVKHTVPVVRVTNWLRSSGSPKEVALKTRLTGNPGVERLGFLPDGFEWALAGGRLFLLSRDFGTDGRETLFGEVAAKLAVGH